MVTDCKLRVAGYLLLGVVGLVFVLLPLRIVLTQLIQRKDMSLDEPGDAASELSQRQMLSWCLEGTELSRRRHHKAIAPRNIDPAPLEVFYSPS